jgi:hypothetical protein
MKTLASTMIMALLLLLGAHPASADLSPDHPAQFTCHLEEIQGGADQYDSLDFTRTVTPCPEGMCLVPIDHLQSKIACRDFTVSYGDSGADLDISLWSYCGAATDPAKSQSQTLSIASDSRRFQRTRSPSTALSEGSVRKSKSAAFTESSPMSTPSREARTRDPTRTSFSPRRSAPAPRSR